MPLVNAKCTCCGANLEINDSEQAAVCQFCGNAFVVEQAINNYNVTNNVTNNIQANNVTIVQQSNAADFEVVAGGLVKYNGSDADVVIPDNITQIGKEAFKDLNISSVTIPGNVRLIDERAFENCKSLKSVVINEGVEKIEYRAFHGCESLLSVTIPKGVQIGRGAFDWCKSLQSIELPEGLESIGGDTFNCCYALNSVKIPEGVKFIHGNAFKSCWALKSITIPKSVITIYGKAFEGCKDLDVTFEGKPEIEPDAFESSVRKQWVNSEGGCYVATCIYGDYNCPQVWTLRRFRDNTLAESWYGRAFIRLYYAISPLIVRKFGDRKWFHSIFKNPLDRFVRKLNEQGVADTPYKDK